MACICGISGEIKRGMGTPMEAAEVQKIQRLNKGEYSMQQRDM